MEILSTPRLHLVPLSGEVVRRRLADDDFEVLLDLPDGARTVHFGPTWPGDPLPTYVALADRLGDGVAELRYVAVERDTPQPQALAELGAKGPIAADGSVEIGYGVVLEARDRGLGTEAVGALVDELVARGATTVLAHTEPDNIASRRVLENTGFTRRGTAHEDDHGEVDVWVRTTG